MTNKHTQMLSEFEESLARFKQELRSYSVIPVELVRDANPLARLAITHAKWDECEPLAKKLLLDDSRVYVREAAYEAASESDCKSVMTDVTTFSNAHMNITRHGDDKKLSIHPYFVPATGEVKVCVISNNESHTLTLPRPAKHLQAADQVLWSMFDGTTADWHVDDGCVRLADVLVGAEYLNQMSEDFLVFNQEKDQPLPVFKAPGVLASLSSPLFVYDAQASDNAGGLPCDFPNKVFETPDEFLSYVTEIASFHEFKQFAVLSQDKTLDVYHRVNEVYELQTDEPESSWSPS